MSYFLNTYELDEWYEQMEDAAYASDNDMMMMMMRTPTMMIKRLTNLFLFLIPLTITYAIVSSIGTTGNYYGAPNSVNVSR